METNKKKWSARLTALFFILFAFAFTSVKAQVPCPRIINTTHCKIQVKIEIYKRVQNQCLICHNYAASVPPGAAIPVNCICGPVCNVKVTVTHIDGVPVGPTTADITSLPPGVPIALPATPIPCLAGMPVFIEFNGVDFVIHH